MHKIIMIAIICCSVSFLNIDRTTAQVCPADKEKSWSYQPRFSNGPPHWGNKYPDCKGKSQSPINIITSKLSKAKGNLKLKLVGYEKPITKVKIENNGHTIDIDPEDGVKRYLEVDNDKYDLVGIHFHWGDYNSRGSEHKINGQKYTMEGHFVHNNSKGEIAVVGVFYFQGGNGKLNSALDNILYEMRSYMYEGESFQGSIWRFSFYSHRRGSIYLEDLVNNGCSYYRYDGSLTTPPCTENVKWLLCKKPKSVDRSQMKRLFSLYSVKRGTKNIQKCHLINNNRPVQALNGRKIYG